MNLAESLGDIDPGHPVYPHVDGYQSIVLLKNDENNKPDTNDWHKDLTFKANPPFASILHAIKVPKVGGDTLWASMSAAYDQLPAGWKNQLENLEAIHDMGTFRNDFFKEGGIDSVNSALQKVYRLDNTDEIMMRDIKKLEKDKEELAKKVYSYK